MTRFLRYGLIVCGTMMSILLFLLTISLEKFTDIQKYYLPLLEANFAAGFILLVFVIVLLWQLISRFRRKEFGSRLKTRLVLLFAIVGIVPGIVIYFLSLTIVSRSIESWFKGNVEFTMTASKSLGRGALDLSLKDLQAKARRMTNQLSQASNNDLPIKLNLLREEMNVQEATLISKNGNLLATASENLTQLSAEIPNKEELKSALDSGFFSKTETINIVSTEPINTLKNIDKLRRSLVESEPRQNYRSRVIVRLFLSNSMREQVFLQLIQPIPNEIVNDVESVRLAYAEFDRNNKGRDGLKNLYVMTLTLTMLVAFFFAIISAFMISDQLAKPLLLLAEGTKAVAEGNLSPRPIITSSDELGSLTQSFNIMTRQLFDARSTVEKNRTELENAKAYLESVLANMSAGVMVLDQHSQLVTCNDSVSRILQNDLSKEIGKSIKEIDGMLPFAIAIDKAFSEQHAQSAAGGDDENTQHWQQQIEIPRAPSQQLNVSAPNNTEEQGITLLARGSHLPVASGNGYVIVFDDISNIISAQRSIAWGEVARRLAHEIKNPLTPIQLSAERLQMKLQDKLNDIDVGFLNKSTSTIVNQVSSMKRMVDDFRDYAKTPNAVLSSLNLSNLIDDVLHLYLSGDGKDTIRVKLASNLPLIMGDATQLRQVIHNLLQNAQDAVTERSSTEAPAQIDVVTELVRYVAVDNSERTAVRMTITDNGPGFSSKILARAFEPYATSKPRGTGLGLAMVKKIIDEHGGRIDIQNRVDTNGAKISILLLKLAPDSSI